MNTLIPGATPLADAATPKAMPNGITNAAMGAISTLPRHTPLAVKRGRSSRVESGISPDIEGSFETGPVVWSIDWTSLRGIGRRLLVAQSGVTEMSAMCRLSAAKANNICSF